jgi:hypothetical protein
MVTEIKNVQEIRINEASVSLREDGIVRVLFHRRVVLDLSLQMLLLNIYNEITRKKPHPFLFEALDGVKVTREARENALLIEEQAPGSAYAVVAGSIRYRILANFYIRFRKPQKPYRVFRTPSEAVDWLRQFVEARGGPAEAAVRNS